MIMINNYFVERPCQGKYIKKRIQLRKPSIHADNIMIFGEIVFISI